MALEIKHLQTNDAGELSRLRAENAKLKAKNAQLEDDVAFWKKKLSSCRNGDCILTCDTIEKYGKENVRFKRALWLARAERAIEKIAWFKLWNASISTMNPEDGARQEFDKWKKALGKFLVKAKEYK